MPIRVNSKRVEPASAPDSQELPFGLPAPPAGEMQKPAGISLCMIVKNEERFLPACLRSAADIVDEICVVDTGSTDRTVAIAKSFGAAVVEREWRNDFAWARNEAIAMANKRWILMLDADEELQPDSKPALAQLKNVPAAHVGVWLRCYNESDDYRGTGAMSHALVRIFPNTPRIRFRGMIHEFVTLDGTADGLPAVTAPISIVHHGYLADVVEGRNKASRNFEIVKAMTEADPTDPFAWFNLGSTAFLMGDFEDARDAFEKMRELNGKATRGFIANAHAILAEIYCDKLNDAVKGEEVARDALFFSPHYANAHFQLGKALVAQQRFDEGRAAFVEAIEDGRYAHQQFVVDDQVSIWKSYSEIGASFVMQGDEKSAIDWFRRGLQNAPKVQPLRLNLARALERTGAMDEARALFRGVYEEFADSPSTVDYVNFLLRRKDGEAALAVIDESVDRLDAESAVPVFLAAAQIAMRLGRTSEMVRYLELAAKREPGNAEVLNPLEAAYRERGDAAALSALLAGEAQTEPTKPADFLRRSYNANVAHEFERGLTLAEAGLELEPGNEHLHYNAAVSAGSLGKLELALEHLAHVPTSNAPVYVPSEILRSNVLRELGRIDEAVAAIERVLARDAGNVDALRARAGLQERRGDVGAAEGTLQRLMAIDRQAGAVELASLFMRQGRFEDAARVADAGLRN